MLALGGCGGASDDRTQTAPPRPPPRPETIDHVPKLPDRWQRYVDGPDGFALGLPPGWKASREGSGALIRSYDRLVAISVAPDRSRRALAVPIGEYARRAAEALPGYRQGVRLKGQGRLDHRYEGVEVRAVGTARKGIDQRVSVIVLRRDALVTFTVVLAKNANRRAGPSKVLAKRVVETLRSRPPEHRGGGGARGSSNRGRKRSEDAQRSGRSG
jgi:hypothetical protein